jgi:hypothetical protein
MQVATPVYSTDSTICVDGVADQCDPIYEPQSTSIYEVAASTLPYNNCVQ